MPSNSCSKTVSRRSDRFRLLVLLAALTLPAALAGGQSLDVRVASGPEGIRASLLFRWARQEELVASLRDGMEARIVFTLRVYQRRSGFFPFPRDRLVVQTTVARSAFWDFLDRIFVVESDDGTRSAYQNATDLLNGFFSLTDFLLLHGPLGREEPRYVTARARLEPVRLMAPLTIVTLAGAAASYTTPWTRKAAP